MQTERAVLGHTLIFGHLIAGEEINQGPERTRINPALHQDRVAVFPEGNRETLLRAARTAREAFGNWSQVPAPVRGQVLFRLAQILGREKDHLARLMAREVGKTLKEAGGDIQEAIDTAIFFASEGRRLYGQTVPSEMPGKELFTFRRPLGVVGIITAGNFPIAVPSWKIIPALLAGNTVVWKPSDDSPALSYVFAKLFEEAGLPAGVLNVVFGGSETGKALVELVDQGYFDKIAFTGSSAVGRWIGEVCGRNLIRPTLELGGKNPLVVLADAELEQAVEGAWWSAYATGGQRCTSAGNILVDRAIYEPFKERFLERVYQTRVGNPLAESVDYGPMINERFLRRFLEQRSWGDGDLLYGGERVTSQSHFPGFAGDPEEGWFAWPTVWETRPGTRLFDEEVFGPTINLVPFDGVEQAIEYANSVAYGLSSALYTNRRDWAYLFKSQIKAGMTSVNNTTVGAEAHLPFGGIKASGDGGRESGIWVIEEYTYWQAINEDYSGKLQLAQMDTPAPEARAAMNWKDLLGF